MIKSDHSKYNLPAVILYPGEYYVSGDDCVLITVTGSCLVVVMHDEKRRLGGIAHFILPGQTGTGGVSEDEVISYAVTQLEYLFGEFVKKGGNRKDLIAKVFGAAEVDSQNRVNHKMITSNVRFIHNFFSKEKIPVEHLDLAGVSRRKIIFFPRSGKTFRKILTQNETDSEIIRLENDYINEAFKKAHEKTRYVLFD